MRKGSIRSSLVIAVLAAGVLGGCSSPERELRKAKAAGTIEALDAFLARHPEGPLSEQAKDAKEQIVFDGAKAIDTVAAYQDFLKRYPSGKLTGAAQSAIEELHFKDAQTADTVQAYESFMSMHPQSSRAKLVNQALDRLLPIGTVMARAAVTNTDSASCTIFSTVTILHRSDALNVESLSTVAPGMMNCSGTTWPAGVEVEKVEQRDPNHLVLHLKFYSAPEYTGCRGTCMVRFSAMGQEHMVTALYR
ncbi:MAG: hypothetical protein JXO72_03390 [Vicinamibacteria bacterium]|nr:hypothetical protein [Vicinamibacteria bacterium]